MAVIHTPSASRSAPQSHAATPVARLLAELQPDSDLVWLVERVSRAGLPWVVIPATAITEWERRDPAGWEKVSEWLAAQGITTVQI